MAGECYRIARWAECYEVDANGRGWKPGCVLRRGELDFVRMKVHGRAQGASYRRLIHVCSDGSRLMAAMATFGKLLELAASNNADLRGWILNEQDQPASIDDIAFFTGFPGPAIQQAIADLSHPTVAWVETALFSRNPAIDAERREKAPHIRSEQNRTEQNIAAPAKRADGDDADAARDADWKQVLECIEARLGRDLTASEQSRLHKLLLTVEQRPVVVDGSPQGTVEVFEAAIGTLPADVRSWPAYLAKVLDEWRRDGRVGEAAGAAKSNGRAAELLAKSEAIR